MRLKSQRNTGFLSKCLHLSSFAFLYSDINLSGELNFTEIHSKSKNIL